MARSPLRWRSPPGASDSGLTRGDQRERRRRRRVADGRQHRPGDARARARRRVQRRVRPRPSARDRRAVGGDRQRRQRDRRLAALQRRPNNEIDGARHPAATANTAWTAQSPSITTTGHELHRAGRRRQSERPDWSSRSWTRRPDSAGRHRHGLRRLGSHADDRDPVRRPAVTHGPAVTMLDKGGAAVGWSTSNAVQMSLRPPSGSFPPPAQVKSVTTSTPRQLHARQRRPGRDHRRLVRVQHEHRRRTSSACRSSPKRARHSARRRSSPTRRSSRARRCCRSTNPATQWPRSRSDPVTTRASRPRSTTTRRRPSGRSAGPSTGTTGTPVTLLDPAADGLVHGVAEHCLELRRRERDGHRDAGVSHVQRSRWLHGHRDRHR